MTVLWPCAREADRNFYYAWWRGLHCLMVHEGLRAELYRCTARYLGSYGWEHKNSSSYPIGNSQSPGPLLFMALHRHGKDYAMVRKYEGKSLDPLCWTLNTTTGSLTFISSDIQIESSSINLNTILIKYAGVAPNHRSTGWRNWFGVLGWCWSGDNSRCEWNSEAALRGADLKRMWQRLFERGSDISGF